MECAWIAQYVSSEKKIRLKNQGSHSVHYVSHQGNQGAWKEIYEEAW